MLGAHWLQLKRENKILFVFMAVRSLRNMGIGLSLTHLEYAELLDQYIASHPELLSEDLGNIFANMVYAAEPKIQNQLKRISKPRHNPWEAGSRPLSSYYDELGLAKDGKAKRPKEDYAP